MLVLAEFERYSMDHLLSLSANVLFVLSMRFMKNSNRDRCTAHLCTLKSTCRGELGLSVRGAKTTTRYQ